jgi:hypothetical protein
MPGIQQWSKNVQVQANPGKRLRYLDASFLTGVAALTGVATINLYAPIGFISRVKIARLKWDPIAGATSGSVAISVASQSTALLTTCSQAWNGGALDYGYGLWMNTPATVLPIDQTAQFLMQNNMVFDENNPLQVYFENKLNVADPGVKKWINLWIEDEKITA